MKIKVAKIRIERVSLSRNRPDIITEFHTVDYFKNDYFGYDLDTGRSYMYERGAKKISPNEKIKTFKSLVSNLDKASSNSCRSYQDKYYSIAEEGYIDSKDLVEGMPEYSEEFQKLVHTNAKN